MTHVSQPAGAKMTERIAVRVVPSTGSSLSRCPRRSGEPGALLPVIGANDVILPSFEETLASFAIRAQQGDRDARDALFVAFQPKLGRMMSSIRPPFAPNGAEGVWNRGDVEQEAYLVFVELVEAWSGDIPFPSFLLSRFSWRLKDVIFRGIGKPSAPPRSRSIPLESVALEEVDTLNSPDAREVLERLMRNLDDPLPAILVAHIVEGRSKTQIARELGISRRTMVRYWRDIRVRAMDVIGEGA